MAGDVTIPNRDSLALQVRGCIAGLRLSAVAMHGRAPFVPEFLASMIAVSALLGACHSDRDTPGRVLADSDLINLAALPYDKSRMMNKSILVGTHHGTPVRVNYFCGDICPGYTTKLVHYDVAPTACPQADGEVLNVDVPAAASVMLRPFCFPRVLHVKGVPSRP